MRRIVACIAAIAVVTVLFDHEAETFAAMGKIENPDVGLPFDFPATEREAIREVLQGDEYTFVDGHWLNSLTTLNYRGDAEALNLFLDRLSKCKDLKIHLRFVAGSDADWTVTHGWSPREFGVQINVSSDRLKLEQLRLPPIHTAVE